MARTLTPQDCHVLMNALVKQATGQSTSSVVDTSSFVSAGEKVLASGVENTLNALSIVLGRTFMAVRPYKAKLNIISAMNSDLYNSRLRKISFYSREAKASGDWNTQLNGVNLKDGRDNSGVNPDQGTNSATPSMWEQNQPVPLEMNFAGQSVWEDSTTVYKYQLKIAFSSEAEFSKFVTGIMTEKANDIESQKEAFNRMTLLNYIAGVVDLEASDPMGRVINLTEAYNTFYGTNYTSAQLRSTYLRSFLEFMVATIKQTSDYMTHRSTKYHWSPAKTIGDTSYTLLRHTPKDKQKLVMYSPLFNKAESMVMPEIFNPQYLSINNYEGVDFWQSFAGDDTDASINVTPTIPNGNTQIAGNNVSLDYVVGMIFDTDALMVDYQLEDAESTPLEARKRYYNIWWSFSKNAINDFTENSVIFIMKDSNEGQK